MLKMIASSGFLTALECFAPDPAGGAYTALPRPLSGLRGPTSKGREGRGERKREEERKGRKGAVKKGEGKKGVGRGGTEGRWKEREGMEGSGREGRKVETRLSSIPTYNASEM